MSQIKRRINELFDRRDELDLILANPDLTIEERDQLMKEREQVMSQIINLYH